jgi:hypothetical protein
MKPVPILEAWAALSTLVERACAGGVRSRTSALTSPAA